MFRRSILALGCALGLAACGVDKTYDPQPQVDAARFVSGEPPSITLVTVINDRNGSGAHSGLIINASERVLFDPAGTFEHPSLPIQNDVHFGMTDRMIDFYIDYHTRDNPTEEFHVVEHKLYVSAQTAELIYRKVKEYGPVPKAQCTQSISAILRSVPGFESLPSTWFPTKFGEAFAQLPGVTSTKLTEATDNGSHGVIMVDKKGNRIN